jgi:TonB family protein
MAATPPIRFAPEWDARFTRMVAVSALGHVAVIVLVLLVATRLPPPPPPLVAYTVEITDPSALGGRLPPGPPAPVLAGGRQTPPLPEPKGDAGPEPVKAEPPKAEPAKAEPPKPEEVKPEPPKPEPVVKVDEPKPLAKPAEPKPPPKPEVAKAEPPKPEPPKPEPAKAEPPKPQPAKSEAAKPEPAKPEPAKAEATKPPQTTKPTSPDAAHAAGSAAGHEDAPPHDAYAAAAERWRSRAGGGVGGTDAGSGPIGSGGAGPGGGGQVVGIEFLAYRQQVVNTIKAQWTNVITTPGLVASVRFEIAPDGTVSNPRIEQASGNAAYDASVLRAVQRTTELPPPPARYQHDFRDFLIEFHSEDRGGQGTG